MAHIQTTVQDHVLVITLNRPEARNAFDRAMAETMEAVMDDYEAQPELRVAILRAEGPTFSAGAGQRHHARPDALPTAASAANRAPQRRARKSASGAA